MILNDKNIVLKIKSITDVITNSSTEVFTIYDENGINDVKKLVNSILDIAYSLQPTDIKKYYFDDLFNVCYSIEYDYISDEIEDYISEEMGEEKLTEYQNLDYGKEINEWLEKNISYEKLLQLAKDYDESSYEGGKAVCGIVVTKKENCPLSNDVLNPAIEYIKNIDSTFGHDACYC